LPHMKVVKSQGQVRLQVEDRVWLALGQGEERRRLFQRAPELRPHMVVKPQAPQHLGQLWGVPHLLAERTHPVVGLFDLWSRIARGDAQHGAEGRWEAQRVLGTLRGVWKGLEDPEPA